MSAVAAPPEVRPDAPARRAAPDPIPPERRGGIGPALVARAVVGVVVVAVGTLALRTAWTGFTAWPGMVAMGLLAMATVWLLRRLAVAPAVIALAALTVPVLLLVAVGRLENLSPLEAVTNSFPSLLTSPFPTSPTPFLLAPGFVIAWAAGAVLGFGLTRPAFVGPPLGAAVLLLLSAELLSAGSSDSTGLLTLGIVAVLLAYWSGWGRRSRSGLPAGTALAVVLGVLALAVGLIPLGRPFQPRELLDPPSTTTQEPNPLPMLSHWARNPHEEVLRRTGDTYPLHLVVLPDYDGVSFVSASKYVALGSADRPLLPPGRYQMEVTTSVTWRTTSRWLPAPGVPREVSVPGALVDVDTGSLLTKQVPQGGVVSYTVRGDVDAARLAEVAGADVSHEPRYTTLPAVPPDFADYAREVTAGSSTYVEQALALERAVKAGRAFDPAAQGGSSYGRLHDFLFTPPARGGSTGTSEQFAAAFAVLARSVGLPTRVVVGFGPGEPVPTDPATRIVRGRDALAWPEVYFAGYGWVAFNPTPDVHAVDSPERNQPRPPETRPTPKPSPTPPPSPRAGEDDEDRWWLTPVVGGLGVGGLALILALARRVRAAAQRRRGPLGAWQRIEDAMVLGGRPPDRSHAAPDRAAALGVPGAREVAVAAEAAAFAPEPPPAPETSWQNAESVQRALRREVSWWRRATWSINPLVWLRRGG